MQQDNNFIDKLRELDDAEAADISNLNTDWKDMKAMLPTTEKGIGKNHLRNIIVGIVLIGVIAFFIKNNFSDSENVSSNYNVTANSNQPKNIETKSDIDTVVKKDSTIKNTVTQKNVSNDVNDLKKMRSALLNAKPIFDEGYLGKIVKQNNLGKKNFDEKLEGKIDDTTSKPIDETSLSIDERRNLLKELLKTFEVEPQQFIIDNTKDSLLACKYGTVVLIPANALEGKTGIVFTVKEFYKQSEFILNNLTTVSNNQLLESGGMLYLKATYNDKDVAVNVKNPIKIFLPDTKWNMDNMQLFVGNEIKKETDSKLESIEDGDRKINWVGQGQYFQRKSIKREVKVLNIQDNPYRVVEKRKGLKAVFFYNPRTIDLPKLALIDSLKNKFGYDRIKLKKTRSKINNETDLQNDLLTWRGKIIRSYSANIGDSVWMPLELAKKNKLAYGLVKISVINSFNFGNQLFGGDKIDLFDGDKIPKSGKQTSEVLMAEVNGKYSVDLTRLGYINCDRFYNDNRPKYDYVVNLNDDAKCYYTVMLFENFNSLFDGMYKNTKVGFANVPKNEPVKIISIGINKKGVPVYAVKSTKVNKEELTDLEYIRSTSAEIKAKVKLVDEQKNAAKL